MVNAFNYKPFKKGALVGFFDLRYHGATIKGCRVMNGNNGYWVALPSKKTEVNGETKYIDVVELTKSEMEHVRCLVIADLEAQGHIERPAAATRTKAASTPQARSSATPRTPDRATYRSPDGEDLSDCYAPPEPGDECPW